MEETEYIIYLDDILKWGAIAVALIGTFIQIAPVKINPWSALFHWIGKKLNAGIMDKLDIMEAEQVKIRDKLEEHIRMDDERAADGYRRRILSFNSSLLANKAHTEEEFVEIMNVIDMYEKYCAAHPGYKNSRAVHAVAHIGKVYDERLEKHDFLREGTS